MIHGRQGGRCSAKRASVCETAEEYVYNSSVSSTESNRKFYAYSDVSYVVIKYHTNRFYQGLLTYSKSRTSRW